MTRTYRSAARSERAGRTRSAVLAAAGTLFAERGWAATSVRDVAAAAGVSVETVYGAVGAKVTLLVAVVDASLVGDAAPIPLRERPELRALAVGTLADRAATAAALIEEIHRRSLPLLRALREGAVAEPLLAARLTELEDHRWAEVAHGLSLVLGRPPDPDDVDVLWAQSAPDVYDALTSRRGWSGDRYRTWVTELILERETP